jgi:hypothetical protein
MRILIAPGYRRFGGLPPAIPGSTLHSSIDRMIQVPVRRHFNAPKSNGAQNLARRSETETAYR